LRPSLCIASVVQPASEFDKAGVDELLAQTIGALNMKSMPKNVFDRQLAFNLYPALNSDSVERYVVDQVRAINGHVPLSVNITQGTIFHGYTFAVFLQLSPDVKKEQLELAIAASQPFVVADEEGFSTIDSAGKDQLLVGRISADERIAGGFWVWMAVDNLRRVAALNAVLAAEALLARLGPPAN
jgi:aspartate-semialdehyde dehydrogenase